MTGPCATPRVPSPNQMGPVMSAAFGFCTGSVLVAGVIGMGWLLGRLAKAGRR